MQVIVPVGSMHRHHRLSAHLSQNMDIDARNLFIHSAQAKWCGGPVKMSHQNARKDLVSFSIVLRLTSCCPPQAGIYGACWKCRTRCDVSAGATEPMGHLARAARALIDSLLHSRSPCCVQSCSCLCTCRPANHTPGMRHPPPVQAAVLKSRPPDPSPAAPISVHFCIRGSPPLSPVLYFVFGAATLSVQFCIFVFGAAPLSVHFCIRGRVASPVLRSQSRTALSSPTLTSSSAEPGQNTRSSTVSPWPCTHLLGYAHLGGSCAIPFHGG